MKKFCPSCESNKVVVYENDQEDSYCLDCRFTWRQTEGYIAISHDLLENLARKGRSPHSKL